MASSCPCLTKEKKIRTSVQTAILAFVIFNPIVYQLVQKVLGRWVADPSSGCPTPVGLLLHTVLFGFIIFLLMQRRKPKIQRQSVPGLPLR